jgi:DNA-binding response OmpR family regulator
MTEPRLLIVEDNAELAEMLVLFFGSRGLKVMVAPDGETALQLLREALPSLVLLDVGLPDIDGYELFRQFRASARTRYVPVIFLTRRSRKSDRVEGLTLGADDYVSKPFDLEELYLRVQNAVARAERDHLTDPRTGLPTGRVVREAAEAARTRVDRAVVECCLEHADAFTDFYGALAGADVLRYTALLLNRVLNSAGAPDDFLGQASEWCFTVITAAERAEALAKAAAGSFEAEVVQHYSLGQRAGSQVRVRDAAGVEHTLPVMRLAVR